MTGSSVVTCIKGPISPSGSFRIPGGAGVTLVGPRSATRLAGGVAHVGVAASLPGVDGSCLAEAATTLIAISGVRPVQGGPARAGEAPVLELIIASLAVS